MPCSYSKSSTASLVASADSERSRLLEACQTAYYNGSTASSIVLDNNGIFADILCIRDDKLGGNASYEDTQCQVGYTGPLCTNCADGYGNSRTFHCNKCMPSVATNTFLIFLGHLASFCYVAWLVRGCLASAAQVGKADGDHFEQFSDMMKVGLLLSLSSLYFLLRRLQIMLLLPFSPACVTAHVCRSHHCSWCLHIVSLPMLLQLTVLLMLIGASVNVHTE